MSDAAIATLVTGLVTITTIVVAFLTLWVKLRYSVEKTETVEHKLDANTALTKAGTVAAKNAAIKAEAVTSDIAGKINGELDLRIEKAVATLKDDIKDIKDALRKLSEH